ncbi:MAG: glutamate-5-semialdehyde dehydrogenase [Candidatus Korobacteraceae bacterium]|jgi:glutamate-5-semialdehyde dehydrogenase
MGDAPRQKQEPPLENPVAADARAARAAARVLANAGTQQKNAALAAIAVALEAEWPRLQAANALDVAAAEKLVAAGQLKRSLVDRLRLHQDKLQQMVASVAEVQALPDPVGQVRLHTLLDDGLELKKVSFPFGVIAAIVEARPDAVVQLAALALKSGNALLIKAGAEAAHTSECLLQLMSAAIGGAGIPASALALVRDREAVRQLLRMDQWIDLVVPRGGAELVRYVMENSTIPVLGHADGVCHIYIDRHADRKMALEIVLDAKTQAPSVCNAVETVLVDEPIAADFLPELVSSLKQAGVTVLGCARTVELSKGAVAQLAPDTWHTEYGDLTLAMRVVGGVDEAIDHIESFGSRHTDCIVTGDRQTAERFLNSVDSANVFHNVSTRFSDGFRYGFGAEVGISTGKLHARGPVGLDGLVTYRYQLTGSGQCVRQYVGKGARAFKHVRLDED